MTRNRKIKQASLVAFLLAALAVGVFWWSREPATPKSEQWQAWLETATDADALDQLHLLASKEEPPLAVLVEGLLSSRPGVASAAENYLQTQIRHWEALTDQERDLRTGALVNRLAEKSASAQNGSWERAANLIRQVLRGPLPSKESERIEYLAGCEAVLQAASREKRFALAALHRPKEEELLQGRAPLPEASTNGAADAFERREAPTLPRVANEYAPQGSIDNPPLVSPPDLHSEDINEAAPLNIPQGLPRDPPARPLPPESPIPSTELPRESCLPMDRTPHALIELLTDDVDIKALRNIDLMQLLNSPSQALAQQAENELAARGYPAFHRQVAKQMTNPDEQTRLELANNLSSLGLHDLRPWLLWLSHDPSPAVREAIVNTMGTIQDPELRMRIHEMQQEETDPRVLEQINRAIEFMR